MSKVPNHPEDSSPAVGTRLASAENRLNDFGHGCDDKGEEHNSLKAINHIDKKSSIAYKLFIMSATNNISQIRAAREAAGMSMAELARRAGVSQPTVANWEIRERDGRITIATLQRAAEALGADLSYTIDLRTNSAQPRKKKPIPRPQRRAAITRTVAPNRSDPNEIWM